MNSRNQSSSSSSSSFCGGMSGKRGLLASLWSLVTIFTFLSFLIALTFTLSAQDANGGGNNNNYNNQRDRQAVEDEDREPDDNDEQPQMAVTSRAMAFSALWTAVLAVLMSIFGTVILGWQSPTGQYYICCSSQVHKTTPLALGTFIGGLMMFASLTLVCALLFGEFQVRS